MTNDKFILDGREYESSPKIKRMIRKVEMLEAQKKRFWELFMKRSKEIDVLGKKLGEEKKRVARKR